MTEKTRSTLEAALALAPDERAVLVEALLDSLPDDQEDPAEDDLLAELERRRAEADLPGATIPWSVLRDQK